MSSIYVASSWRNPEQPAIVAALREAGHTVYDFRNPRPGETGFQWSEIDPAWQYWSGSGFRAALNDPIAVAGYGSDFAAMEGADCCVMALPCGRSAHLEAGWFAGSGKPLYILLAGEYHSQFEPELMYRMATAICVSLEELVALLAQDGGQ